jgi:TolA-binding protein
MTQMRARKARALALAVMVASTSLMATTLAVPVAHAQDGTVEEIRLRKLEAEVRALQRQVFPGGETQFQGQPTPPPGTTAPGAALPGSPATTPVTDLLSRMDAIEAQNARLTAQVEELSNRMRKLEAQQAAATAAAVTAAPAPGDSAALPPQVGDTPIPAQPRPSRPVVAAPPPKPVAPTAARVAAVKAIIKPQTDDSGEDEYTYGFKLWEAKFYPEAEQQLRMFLDKYPRHKRVSYARNLLGRAYLDDDKPREAANWFLQNYQSNNKGDRAADSLLYLAQTMVALKDTNRACIALGEFADTYKTEATGRLRGQYDDVRKSAACN